jgi:hypothetical protein
VAHGDLLGAYPLTDINSIDIYRSMTVDLEVAPKQKRPAGEPCCQPVAYYVRPEVLTELAGWLSD